MLSKVLMAPNANMRRGCLGGFAEGSVPQPTHQPAPVPLALPPAASPPVPGIHQQTTHPLTHPPLQLFNATAAEDLIVKTSEERGKYVAGAVTNWCVFGF